MLQYSQFLCTYLHPADDTKRYSYGYQVIRVREALSFAAAYLYLNIGTDGQWDLGVKANDKVYLPLSDSWRTEAARRADCTERIRCFLDKIT